MLHHLNLVSSQKYVDETISDPLTDLAVKIFHENCGHGLIKFERYMDDYHRYILLCEGCKEQFMISENLRMIVRKILIQGGQEKIISCWTKHQGDGVEILISMNKES